jgi:6-O-methylguanine DNA methyltransferase, DNA binding domain
MPKLSFLEKLKTAPQASFNVLDSIKSKRMGGVKTLYIPSVDEVAHAIKAIPKGETRTIEELRKGLAKMGNAETACPAKTIKYWKWMASLTEGMLRENPKYSIPWWRVLKDGKTSKHMPGGINNQLSILKKEGVIID